MELKNLGISFVKEKFFLIPKRLTLKCNPPIYRWLYFNISWNLKYYNNFLNQRKRNGN